MKNYQIVFIIDSTKNSKNEAKKVSQLITELKGKINKENTLGKKTLAYRIDKKWEGDYFHYFFSMGEDKVNQLKKEIFQKNMTMRFLLIADEIAKKRQVKK